MDALTVDDNKAGTSGGAFYLTSGPFVQMGNSTIRSNQAAGNGGAFSVSSGGILSLNAGVVVSNSANFGGAFDNSSGVVIVTHSNISYNQAATSGGALYHGSTTNITQSCIISNSVTDIAYTGGGNVLATNDWWGAINGPGGVASGDGDTISANVDFSPFLTEPPAACAGLVSSHDVALAKTVSPAANLLPGQPVTFTLTVSNNDDLPAYGLHVHDQLPALFQVSEITSTDAPVADEVGGLRLLALPGNSSANVYVRGTISSTLSADQAFTNTATVSNSLIALITATAASNVKVPVLSWSQSLYTTSESSPFFFAQINITPTNPYAGIFAVAYTPNSSGNSIGANASSVPVPVTFSDDGIVLSRTVPLTLTSAIGAAIDPNGDTSGLFLIEADAVPALAVTKQANLAQVYVGDTITYTYRITNTGNVSLTVAGASDDKLGAVTGLLGHLDPLATRTATLSHLVQAGDLPGPLANTLTVNAHDPFAHYITPTASVSVNLLAPQPALAVTKQASVSTASVGDAVVYTYRITNTGNIPLATVSAVDDKLGAVGGLAGSLGINASRAATLTHVVQVGDLPGPLVNTVTVTGSDRFGNDASDSAQTGVTLNSTTLDFSKRATPAGKLQPGQPLTYTLTVTNNNAATLDNIVVSDAPPAHFTLDHVATSGPAMTINGNNYTIAHLAAGQVATINLGGVVDATPTSDFTISNSATLNQAQVGTLHAAASNAVVVPEVGWSQNNYTAGENSGSFTATLVLSPTNPYGEVKVNVISTDSSPNALQAAATHEVTFPAGSSSEPVVIGFAGDSQVTTRTITLSLQTVSGAALASGVNGSVAALHLVEADATPNLAVSASVDVASASVGQTIHYTYHITNTGNVTFAVVSALKDGSDPINDLSGQLAPGAARTATLAYVVVEGDRPGPRVSTLDVTATDIFNTVVTGSATTSVSINGATALPEGNQPQQKLRVFLPNINGN
jgi:uncharacterized repeat protein (TIGR01451 family)